MDILGRLGKSAGRRGFILDSEGGEGTYDLDAPQGIKDPHRFCSGKGFDKLFPGNLADSYNTDFDA
jgi:hypothetical protein